MAHQAPELLPRVPLCGDDAMKNAARNWIKRAGHNWIKRGARLKLTHS
jgi:hypothetical protein